ncbi:MAG: hypothetical protein ACRDQ0_13200, partial [Pseudonocardia sp.]
PPTRVAASATAAPTVPSRPLPVFPLAAVEPGSSAPRQRGKAGVLAGTILAVLAVAGAAAMLTGGSSAEQGTLPAGPTAAAPATPGPPVSPPVAIPVPPQVRPVDHSQGSIAWRDAGQLVIDYYTGLGNLPAAWQMLSPTARAAFGSEPNFRSHWSQYSAVSARNASGVRDNPDGSVTVPVDVSYDTGGGAEVIKRELRVIQLDGRLLIDSDPR